MSYLPKIKRYRKKGGVRIRESGERERGKGGYEEETRAQ